ncbi:MAG: DUF3830 family protein [Thermodesulfobacteriota bacterium]
MRKIELELEGVVVKAHLLDEKAPQTCQALWDSLPFEDRVTHSQWSGGRLETNHHPKLTLEKKYYPDIENPSLYQAPGHVVLWPVTNEINIPYAPGRFKKMNRDWVVTHFATIEGDMSRFARKIERLQWEGAKRLVVRRGSESEQRQQTFIPGAGPKIEIASDKSRWVAELFEERVPKHCKAILEALPLKGPITNMHSSGELFHYWVKIPGAPVESETKKERWAVDYLGKPIGTSAVTFFDPREMRAHNPGDILYAPTEGMLIVYGQGFYSAGCQKVGHIIEGDLDDFRELAEQVKWEGTRMLTMRKR